MTWVSSDGAVAAVSNAAGSRGLVTGVSVGSATLSATLSGVSGTTSLTVTAATLVSISVTPASSTLPVGFQRPFTATGNWSDGSTEDLTTRAVWASSAKNRASISNTAGSEGIATGESTGTATISATFAGISGSTLLSVTTESLTTITVVPSSLTLAVRQTFQMTAFGTFSGGTMVEVTLQVKWTSSSGQVATVLNNKGKGLVTAKSPGSAQQRGPPVPWL